jgi:large subunit ribosomal protein L6
MSRIGRKPITIAAGVELTIVDRLITAKGPKGELSVTLLPDLAIKQTDNILEVTKVVENAETQKMYGLQRTLIDNMIIGVSQGYTRQLEINGVGYRAAVAGNTVTLALGFSHPVVYQLPAGVTAAVEKNIITISGFDKQQVGQVAANIRAFKKPEPYKGKGIKYVEEKIRRKAGKTAAKG